ncbi:hypothetical protein BD293_2753 [Roseinatronobacter monicus]|uniref:Uncharacterized protein n=1 Tax=Roseinatronobacter monicus TaxID=393481 RepID=A0A543KG95_9RHOB|nr:hypothetical protein BD293_2753 [Roseinatronobacter monicus]
MMTPPSRIHHVNKRNPLNDAVMSKSDSPGLSPDWSFKVTPIL